MTDTTDTTPTVQSAEQLLNRRQFERALIKAARYGAIACQYAANHSHDQNDPEAAEAWQARADYIEAVLCRKQPRADMDFVTVRRATLRPILDYLHENEADHYEEIVSEYPGTAHEHIYSFVLAIEHELDMGAGAQP